MSETNSAATADATTTTAAPGVGAAVRALPLAYAPETELNRRGFTRRTTSGCIMALPRKHPQSGTLVDTHPNIVIPRAEVEKLADAIEEKHVD